MRKRLPPDAKRVPITMKLAPATLAAFDAFLAGLPYPTTRTAIIERAIAEYLAAHARSAAE